MVNTRKDVTKFVKSCYGCGVCVAACPYECLELKLNATGFYAPVLKKQSSCVNCGLCVKSCSYLNDGLYCNNEVVECGSTYTFDTEIRKHSSSGGFAYELEKKAIEKGYKVCGVHYNVERHRAEHIICNTETELACLQGSKYLQSYTATAFKNFKHGNKYLVIGSPCQIDSLRRLVATKNREDDFILVDFFCHGVPSYLVWHKYLKGTSPFNKNVNRIDFRHKWNYSEDKPISWNRFVITGWDDEGNVYQPYLRTPKEDPFYHYFLGDLCLGKQCYNKCKFKMLHSSADMRIGDAWGATYQKIAEGTSIVLAFTQNATNLLQELQIDRLAWRSIGIDELCEGQMQQAPPMPRHYQTRLKLMNTRVGFKTIDYTLALLDKWGRRRKRLYAHIRRNHNNA